MKKIFGIITVILLLLSVQSCKRETAKMYNNKIITQQVKVVRKIDNLKKSIDDYNILPASEALKNMSAAYDSAVFQIDTSIALIKKMVPFKNDNSLQQAAIKLFTEYKSTIEQNYKQVIELYKLPDQMFTTKDQHKLTRLMKEAKAKLMKSFNDFSSVQKKFGEKNKLSLD